MKPPIRGMQLNALRSAVGASGDLRLSAFPTSMRLLAEKGLVDERPAPKRQHPGGRAWFLTDAGREAVQAYGADEP